MRFPENEPESYQNGDEAVRHRYSLYVLAKGGRGNESRGLLKASWAICVGEGVVVEDLMVFEE